MVTWIIERDIFSEECVTAMVRHFETNAIPFHMIQLTSLNEIDGRVPHIDDQVVCYGSIGIDTVARAHGWNPGTFTSDLFNYLEYRDRLGGLFLNPYCIGLKMSEVSYYFRETVVDFFIKPNGDFKEFSGILLNTTNFDDWYKKMLDIGYLSVDNDLDVIISAPKEIGAEFRFAVVDGKIVGHCCYKGSTPINPDVWSCVEQAIAMFSPAPVFMVDVAETPYGPKIIEYNTFNTASMYSMNVGSVIDGVNAYLRK